MRRLPSNILEPFFYSVLSCLFVLAVSSNSVQAQAPQLSEPQLTFSIGPGFGWSGIAAIDATGRYYLIHTNEDDLVVEDNNNGGDFLVYDREREEYRLVSLGINGQQGQGHLLDANLSADGRFAAFSSVDTNLLTADENGNESDVFLRDISQGTTVLISRSGAGVQGNGGSRSPSLSADGRYIAFESYATNLADADGNGTQSDVFLHDRITSETILVSKDSNGVPGNDSSGSAEISDDGRYIVYTSSATNLVGDDTNGVDDVFLFDRVTQQTRRVSLDANGLQANGGSAVCAISGDGKVVGFVSQAANLLPPGPADTSDVYVKDLASGAVSLISKNTGEIRANGASSACALNRDGSMTAFRSAATNLVEGDVNGIADIFLHNRNTSRTTLVSVSSAGYQAQDVLSGILAMSGDGRFIGYTSWAGLEGDGSPAGEPAAFVTSLDPDVLDRVMYGVWNSYLGMTNVLELVNKTEVARTLKLVLLNSAGAEAGWIDVPLAARGQFDVVLNGVSGFAPESYGTVRLYEEAHYGAIQRTGSSMGGAIDARVVFYRADQNGGYEFAYALPVVNPIHGPSYAAFNTYQPSTAPQDRANPVYNWLSIINLHEQAFAFTINRFSLSGEPVSSETRELAAFGARVDVDGGHGLGADRVGYVEIIPSNPNARYLAELVRYGADSSGGYDFAFPLLAQTPCRTSWIGISSGGGGQNWLELQNVTNNTQVVQLRAYDNLGQEAHAEIMELPPHTGRHIEASSFVPNGLSGAVQVETGGDDALLLQSMFYFRSSTGGIESMYGMQGKETIGGARWGSWNLYLGMYNWLRLFNTGVEAEEVTLTVYGGSQGERQESILLLPLTGRDVGLHETARWGTTAQAYGLFRVQSSNVTTQLLRIRPAAPAGFDFVAPMPVRR